MSEESSAEDDPVARHACRPPTRRSLLGAAAASSLLASTALPASGQNAAASQPAAARPSARPRPCLVAHYSGSSGAFTVEQFDAALLAGIQAMLPLRLKADGKADRDRLDEHLSALRELRTGLER